MTARAENSSPTRRLTLVVRAPVGPLLALAFAARTTAAVLPVTLLLALADTYGYGRAALVGGSTTLILAVLAPLRARLLDRAGHRHALVLMGSTAMALTTASAFSVHAHWPWPSTLALVLGAALSSPPLNAALRSSWRRLIPDPTHLKTVHTADSILEEAGFVVAPLTAGALLALLGPIPAYEAAVAAFLTVITCYLVAARTWELIPTAPPAGPPRTGTGQRAYRWLGPLAQPTLLMILIPMLVMGCLFGGTGIYVPAYLQHQHTPALIGPLLASLSAGGVVGGLLYAALPTGRIPLWRLYRLLTAGFAAPACLLPLAHTPWLLAVLLAASGLFVTPLFITAFLLVDAHATDDVRTEANSWIPASTDVANGIVAAIIGAMAARAHFTSALTLLAACAAGGILAAVLLPTPKNPAPAKTPQTAPASPPSGSTTAART